VGETELQPKVRNRTATESCRNRLGTRKTRTFKAIMRLEKGTVVGPNDGVGVSTVRQRRIKPKTLETKR